MKQTDLAYVAGLLDGEGYVGILKVRKGNKKEWHYTREFMHVPCIKVVMTDKEPIEWLYKTIGGTFATRPRRDQRNISYEWMLRKKQTSTILKRLLPFLKVKRQSAEIIIRLCELSKPFGRGVSDENFNERERLYWEIKNYHTKKPRRGTEGSCRD